MERYDFRQLKVRGWLFYGVRSIEITDSLCAAKLDKAIKLAVAGLADKESDADRATCVALLYDAMCVMSGGHPLAKPHAIRWHDMGLILGISGNGYCASVFDPNEQGRYIAGLIASTETRANGFIRFSRKG